MTILKRADFWPLYQKVITEKTITVSFVSSLRDEKFKNHGSLLNLMPYKKLINYLSLMRQNVTDRY